MSITDHLFSQSLSEMGLILPLNPSPSFHSLVKSHLRLLQLSRQLSEAPLVKSTSLHIIELLLTTAYPGPMQPSSSLPFLSDKDFDRLFGIQCRIKTEPKESSSHSPPPSSASFSWAKVFVRLDQGQMALRLAQILIHCLITEGHVEGLIIMFQYCFPLFRNEAFLLFRYLEKVQWNQTIQQRVHLHHFFHLINNIEFIEEILELIQTGKPVSVLPLPKSEENKLVVHLSEQKLSILTYVNTLAEPLSVADQIRSFLLEKKAFLLTLSDTSVD